MKLRQLHRFFLQLPPPISLATITSVHIDAFIHQAQQRGYDPATINIYLYTLRDCFAFLQEEGHLQQNPVKPHRHYLSVPMRLPKPMEREDVRQLLAARHSARDRALFLVALHSGLRISEVVHLKLSDLDWERHTLRVNCSKAGVDRIVYLTALVEESLRAWLNVRVSCNEYLFCSRCSRHHPGRPMHRRQVLNLFKAALVTAGIDPCRYCFHSLRHTFATELVNAGISLRSLQELLGHKSLTEVLIYARLYESTKRQEFYRAMAAIEGSSVQQPLAAGRR